jgi:hypothetical protein
MTTKRVKVMEVWAEVSDEDPNPRFGWQFFNNFSLHSIIGLLEHIKETVLRNLMGQTWTEDKK